MQKLLLLADPDGREKCVGREVDDFLEIEAVPEATSLGDWGDRACQHIRKLAHDDVKEGEAPNEVMVEIAGNRVWEVIMSHIRVSMEKEGLSVKVRFFGENNG